MKISAAPRCKRKGMEQAPRSPPDCSRDPGVQPASAAQQQLIPAARPKPTVNKTQKLHNKSLLKPLAEKSQKPSET